MSLINNMLKDLESRQLRDAYDQDSLLGGVKVSGSGRKAIRWWVPILLMLIVLVGAFGIWMYSYYQPAIPPVAEPVTPLAEQRPVVPDQKKEAEITAVSSRSTAEGPELIITLKGRAGGVILRQAGQESSLSLKEVAIPDSLTLPSAVLAEFPGMSLDVENKEVRILLPLMQGESLQLSDSGTKENQQIVLTRSHQIIEQAVSPKTRPMVNPPKQDMEVAAHKPETKTRPAPQEPMPVVKQRIAPSPVERAEHSYNRAYSALQEGDLAKAERNLRQSIGLHPIPEAYRALAGILIKQNNSSAARQLLDKALVRMPGNAEIAYLYARLLVDAGRNEKAQKILAEAMTQGRRDPEYLALFAAVSRQLGHNPMAARAYTEALNLKPGVAVWWMGLGLALDEDRQRRPALEAYYKALALGLGDSLDTYVMKRVQELEGEQ